MMAHEKYMQNDDHRTPVKSPTPVAKKDQSSKAMAGGFFIALTTLVGFFVGAFNGEVSIGALGGFGIGIAIAIVIWLNDLKKQRK